MTQERGERKIRKGETEQRWGGKEIGKEGEGRGRMEGKGGIGKGRREMGKGEVEQRWGGKKMGKGGEGRGRVEGKGGRGKGRRKDR